MGNRSKFDCLYEVFDCTNHNLLIARLNAYRVEKRSLDFFHSYLTEGKRSTTESSFIALETLLSGVSQWSVLRSHLLSIYIHDTFSEAPSNIACAGYADDNTSYTCTKQSLRTNRETLSMVLCKLSSIKCGKIYSSNRYLYVKCHGLGWKNNQNTRNETCR